MIGSFIQNRLPEKFTQFRFKHHYILNALDSEILYKLFSAIGEGRLVTFTSRRQQTVVLPMKVYIGTQTGRQYLFAWSPETKRFSFFRADLMDNVKAGDVFEPPADLKERMEEFCSHTWGVTGNNNTRLEHIEMTVFAAPEESHIVERLEREKRCGRVERLDDTHWRFTADVYEVYEMLPWLRTFTGRITELKCSDRRLIDRFREDFDEVTKMYGGGGYAVS